MYKYYNPNPLGKFIDDCVIRAITKVLNITWDQAYIELSMKTFIAKEIRIDSNAIWGGYLYDKGFRQHLFNDICPGCVTVRDFVYENPKGTYILATGTHVIAVVDGVYYDSWDSGSENPIFYWKKEY